MKLYELTEQHRELVALADGDNTELELALADTFEAIEGEFNDKAVALIEVTKNLDSDCESIDKEIERLSNRKKSIQGKKEWMREYLRSNMEASGITKIECPLFSITLGKGRDVVEITDQDKIPADYLNIKTTFAPAKADILRELKAGKKIPGCKLAKSKSSLRIK